MSGGFKQIQVCYKKQIHFFITPGTNFAFALLQHKNIKKLACFGGVKARPYKIPDRSAWPLGSECGFNSARLFPCRASSGLPPNQPACPNARPARGGSSRPGRAKLPALVIHPKQAFFLCIFPVPGAGSPAPVTWAPRRRDPPRAPALWPAPPGGPSGA